MSDIKTGIAGLSFADLAQLAGAAKTEDSVYTAVPNVERLENGGVRVSFEIPVSAVESAKRSQDGEGPSLVLARMYGTLMPLRDMYPAVSECE